MREGNGQEDSLDDIKDVREIYLISHEGPEALLSLRLLSCFCNPPSKCIQLIPYLTPFPIQIKGPDANGIPIDYEGTIGSKHVFSLGIQDQPRDIARGLSVLVLYIGEYLVKVSRNIGRTAIF